MSRVSAPPSRVQALMLGVVNYRQDIDGRMFVVAALAVYFLIVALPRILFGANIWPALGVPTGPSLFFDTRNVTAALECRRLGYDPLVQNPCDPWGRPLNYPRVWLILRWLGLNQSHTDALAIIFIGLFVCSILLLVGRISLGRGMLVALAACSPSVMFAIERANMDIVVFSILVLAVIFWRRKTKAARMASPLIVLAAATAKIYPIFAMPSYLFLRSRRALIAALFCLVAFGVYALLTIGDIQDVARVAPQGDYHSFGARILPAAIYHRFVPSRWQGGLVTKQLLAIIPMLVVAPAVWIVGRRRFQRADPTAESSDRLSFYIGSIIFIGTFAVGNNFDYRLVFLLLTLPQLLDWISDASDTRSSLASIATLAVLFLFWIGALSGPLRLYDEAATWAALALLGVLLAASIPPIRAIWHTIRSQ